MKISIVTPVYNGMPWLPECIESVASQRGPGVDLEYLVFDGGSTDGSAEWLREHASLGYRAVIGPDDGQTDALIKGFNAATGEIFGWLGADDLLEPGALQRVVDVFEAHPGLAMTTAVCLLIDAGGAITGAIPPPPDASLEGLLRHPTNPAQPATFFSADAYRRSGGLDRKYDLAMDVDLWLKLARVGPSEVLSGDVLARFRIHPDAKSVAGHAAAVRQDLRIRRLHGMKLRSGAGLQLVDLGYIRPLVSPWKRAFRRVARFAILGRRRSGSGAPGAPGAPGAQQGGS